MINPLTALTYVLVVTAAVLVSSGLLLRWKYRRPDADELERRRRSRVNRLGRLTEGQIIEVLDEPEAAHGSRALVVYNYEVRGVEYQSAQDISFFRQALDLRGLATGRHTSVKYDPQNPTNSIILCEDWSGI